MRHDAGAIPASRIKNDEELRVGQVWKPPPATSAPSYVQSPVRVALTSIDRGMCRRAMEPRHHTCPSKAWGAMARRNADGTEDACKALTIMFVDILYAPHGGA